MGLIDRKKSVNLPANLTGITSKKKNNFVSGAYAVGL